MNKEMRKRLVEAQDLLQKAYDLLDEAKSIVEEVSGDERDKYDNASEGLQATDRFMQLEENADTMDDFVSEIEEAMDTIDDLQNNETFDL